MLKASGATLAIGGHGGAGRRRYDLGNTQG